MATETRTEASAAGKVMVCGAYLVLERPNPALVFACTARFHSTVEARFETHEGGQRSGAAACSSSTDVHVSSPQMMAEMRFELRRGEAEGRAGGSGSTTTTISAAEAQPANPFVELPLLYAL